ncbi:hypothetical protein BU23DRAFT_447732, partial [Bimuria novae-zelandiae CBS 107.79]
VEYGQHIDPTCTRRHPAPQEAARFQDDLSRLVESQALRVRRVYLPGLLTQRFDVPTEMGQKMNEAEDRLGIVPDGPLLESRRPHCYWLDFTQLDMNPYLDVILAQSVLVRLHLSTSLPGLLSFVDVSLSSTFLHVVDQMFFTHQPCKTLGLYMHHPDRQDRQNDEAYSELELLERIHDDGGIRIGQLLRALARQAHRPVSLWTTKTQQLRECFVERNWPTIFIVLDNSRMRSGIDVGSHATRTSLLQTEESREFKQCEWTPRELIEPAKTATIRSQVN